MIIYIFFPCTTIGLIETMITPMTMPMARIATGF